jgi:colicin import membrane protein
MRIYQMEVETKVKGNWAYPTALVSRKDLEAVVLVKVQRDGTILKYELIKRSYNSMFDQSVITAIERTKSMPPFPEGFRQNDEEIEITFNIKDS